MNPDELLKTLGIDLAKDAEHLEPVEGTHDFTIYTRDAKGSGLALKAWLEKNDETGEDDMLLSGVASSTIKDLHGDTMLPSALIDMERAAQNNLTIFLNHSYEVPEDVAGSVRAASISSSAVDEKSGSPIYDLDFKKIRIDRENERAGKSWRSMKGGTKLGLSIGARIPEGGAIRNKKTGTLLIAHVDLLETSIVGIPANPRSWIDAATKSLKSGPKQFPGVDIPVRLQVEAVEVDLEPDALEAVGGPAGGTAGETIVPVDAVAASADPSTTSNAPSQDAQLSQPGNDGAVATPDVIAAATDVLERTADPAVTDDVRDLLTEAHNTLAAVTNALVDVDVARAAAEQRAEAAEAERDAMKANTEEVIVAVANLIDQVGKLPAGRQASFKAIADDAQSQAVDWESMGLAPEVIHMLNRGASTT